MTTEGFQRSILASDGWLPPRKALYRSGELRDVPVYGRYVEPLETAIETAVPRPVTPVWPREATTIANRVNAALRGTFTPADAMAKLRSELAAIEDG